jgi:hypothetical protein
LKSLFRDEQRSTLGYILESTMKEIESAYRQLYDTHYPPMRFLSELGTPIPKAFHAAAELILNIDLHRAVSGDTIDTETVRTLINNAKTWHVELDIEGISYDLKENLERMMSALVAAPENPGALKNLTDCIGMVRSLPFNVDLWKIQNMYWGMITGDYLAFAQKAGRGDKQASEWTGDFASLGKLLKIRIK